MKRSPNRNWLVTFLGLVGILSMLFVPQEQESYAARIHNQSNGYITLAAPDSVAQQGIVNYSAIVYPYTFAGTNLTVTIVITETGNGWGYPMQYRSFVTSHPTIAKDRYTCSKSHYALPCVHHMSFTLKKRADGKPHAPIFNTYYVNASPWQGTTTTMYIQYYWRIAVDPGSPFGASGSGTFLITINI